MIKVVLLLLFHTYYKGKGEKLNLIQSNKEVLRILLAAEKKMERNKFQEAFESIQDFSDSVINEWSSTEQGIYFWICGRSEDYNHHSKEAISCYIKSVDALQSDSDKNLLIRSMIALSKTFSKTGEDEKALHLLKNAYEIAIYENVPTYTQITILFQLGVHHGKLGEIHSAIYFLNQALKYSEELGIQYKPGQIYMSLGICYMQLDRFEESKKSLDNAVLAFQLSKDTENLAGTYMNLGILYGYHQIFDQAAIHLQKAIDIYHELGQIPAKLQCKIKLASYLYQDGEWEDAASYCKSILLEDSKNHSLHFLAYELLSDMEQAKNQNKTALHYIEKALALSEISTSQQNRLLTKKAQLLMKQGEWKKAMEIYAQFST
ncbi:tetratricopeptide repeat protein [Shimazuella kribbensis]|uniref:tetratricopeptide repeat protein n=1 Tax=Shimazuella kribbensis TaxID=139808 RepID=UPI00041B4D2E|nr:tetratricopeptide repeat protein [Shimazuella kribbensis]